MPCCMYIPTGSSLTCDDIPKSSVVCKGARLRGWTFRNGRSRFHLCTRILQCGMAVCMSARVLFSCTLSLSSSLCRSLSLCTCVYIYILPEYIYNVYTYNYVYTHTYTHTHTCQNRSVYQYPVTVYIFLRLSAVCFEVHARSCPFMLTFCVQYWWFWCWRHTTYTATKGHRSWFRASSIASSRLEGSVGKPLEDGRDCIGTDVSVDATQDASSRWCWHCLVTCFEVTASVSCPLCVHPV